MAVLTHFKNKLRGVLNTTFRENPVRINNLALLFFSTILRFCTIVSFPLHLAHNFTIPSEQNLLGCAIEHSFADFYLFL